MTPLSRIEALKEEYYGSFGALDENVIYQRELKREEAFDQLATLASELAAESEWRPASEEPPSAGWYIAASAHGFVYESHWSGTRWRDLGLTTTHWRPMPRGPER
jgi:hypothetical protein